MTEAKATVFLKRAAAILAERVLKLDDIVQQKIYDHWSVCFEKEDPATTDEEFEGVYELI